MSQTLNAYSVLSAPSRHMLERKREVKQDANKLIPLSVRQHEA